MRRNFYLSITFLIFASAVSIMAHPLGNFSVNQYARIEVGKSQVKLRAVLDMAEIPTFQESQTIDTNKDGELSETELNNYVEKISPGYFANLLLTIGEQSIELRPIAKNISLPTGSGNLPTLRIEWDLAGDLPNPANEIQKLRFENKNNLERIGWNEIVVGRVSGINIFDSTAKGSGITDELKSYPQETLSSPLTERTAGFSFTSSTIPPNSKILQNRDGHVSTPVEKDKFAELIAVPEITPTIILFGLLVAFGLGALHALSPGHGKAVVGAYLVGSKGTPKHALFLGATVTITHTLGVFALGLLTLFASNYILPERLMPFLNFFSGLLVFFIGLTLFKNRLFSILGYESSEHQPAKDLHEHDNLPENITHTHGGSTHSHLPPKRVTWRNLLALGISGGLLPCPSALVLMLSAISLNRIGYGIVLTLVFSFGLAATLTAVGLTFLYVGKFLDNPSLSDNRIVKALPVFSAFVIACVGAVICYQSLV
ncbi:MAG: sulfite exporter TauE/SafE family protein [Acidobacteria bacterium]|jgi:ABC-type nickel/cobalt efflux system permease component RcnA|nr:sulfite exporter TauE/SafE family protein [Acidobacteriota bacterium]